MASKNADVTLDFLLSQPAGCWNVALMLRKNLKTNNLCKNLLIQVFELSYPEHFLQDQPIKGVTSNRNELSLQMCWLTFKATSLPVERRDLDSRSCPLNCSISTTFLGIYRSHPQRTPLQIYTVIDPQSKLSISILKQNSKFFQASELDDLTTEWHSFPEITS